MSSIFWVFVGGGLGSLMRFGVAELMSNFKIHLPLATFFVNFLSSFLLGVLLSISFKNHLPANAQYFLITGLCGGLSTFSAFTGETWLLIENGHYDTALLNVAGNVILCLAALIAGIKIAA